MGNVSKWVIILLFLALDSFLYMIEAHQLHQTRDSRGWLSHASHMFKRLRVLKPSTIWINSAPSVTRDMPDGFVSSTAQLRDRDTSDIFVTGGRKLFRALTNPMQNLLWLVKIYHPYLAQFRDNMNFIISDLQNNTKAPNLTNNWHLSKFWVLHSI